MPRYDNRTDKWIGVFRIQGHPRQEKSFKTKREAKEWEVEVKKDAKKRATLALRGMDWLTFSVKYLDYAKAKYIHKTYHEKKLLIEMFSRFIGRNLPVVEISAQQVQDYLLLQTGTRSANSANRDRKNLHSMFAWGQKIHDFPTNPVSKTERFPHDRKEQYVPPERDILKLLSIADRKERLFLLCYLHTAARRSEIFRLKWVDDINFERGEMRLGTRKTKDGSMEYEWVPMTEELKTELMWHYKMTSAKSQYLWTVEEGPYSGQPFTYRHKFLKGLCHRAGVKSFGFHALRRYAASILADKFKVSSKTIQRILRHKNLSTTEVYIKRLNTDLRVTMELLSSVNSSVKLDADNAENDG